MSFILEKFIADCQQAIKSDHAKSAISKLLAEAVSEPDQIYQEVGQPSSAKIQRLHVSSDLTIINVVWAPKMTLLPHNHNMWAVIGVYAGREDNIFWRRLEGDPKGQIKAAGAKSIGPGEVQALGEKLIHSVTNPTSDFTAAIHIYGGDFFAQKRSEWDPQSLHETSYDLDKNMKLFEAENAILGMREKAGTQ